MAVIWGLVILSVGSFIAAAAFVSEDSSAIFFLTPFRAYQFGIGALTTLLGLAHYSNSNQSRLAFIGAMGIVALAIFIDETASVYFAALLPAIFAGMFIIGSSSPLATKLFGSKIFVWIGQRSYSIYLTHWPLVVFWKINSDFEFSYSEKILAVFLSVVSGYLLHLLVEKRFRFTSSQTPKQQRKTLRLILGFIVFVLSASSVFWVNGQDIVNTSEDMKRYAKLGNKWNERLSLLRNGE